MSVDETRSPLEARLALYQAATRELLRDDPEMPLSPLHFTAVYKVEDVEALLRDLRAEREQLQKHAKVLRIEDALKHATESGTQTRLRLYEVIATLRIQQHKAEAEIARLTQALHGLVEKWRADHHEDCTTRPITDYLLGSAWARLACAKDLERAAPVSEENK